MTKNNEYILPKEKPFETVYELKNEVPSFEEFMKSYDESDGSVNYDDLSGGDISVNKGYGPCRTCDKTEVTIEFKMACPAVGCSDNRPDYWHHARSGCENSRMLISTRGWLSCGGCGAGYNMANWNFACSHHRGDYRSMNQDSWNRAMSVALAISNVNQPVRDLQIYITNHPEKFGW